MNTLLNGGHNLRILDDRDIETIWESIFFALWYAEMGRGCEEIIAAVDRACLSSYRMTRIGFQTIAKKWYGLDQYRIDKVSHLARHLLPVLLEQQIKLWLKSRKTGIQNAPCRQILKKTLNQVVSSYGLCYFLLEILAEETSKTLIRVYERLHISVGKCEFKSNIVVFLYKQIVSLATNLKLDSRLLRTFDQYVVKKFIVEILPNESQLSQILISLRLYQSLSKTVKRKNLPSGKCKALLQRWSEIIQDVHEKCIDGEFFPDSITPIKSTVKWTPHIE